MEAPRAVGAVALALGAGGTGVGLGQPGAGKASGHPQQPPACGEGTEKTEPGSPQWHERQWV